MKVSLPIIAAAGAKKEDAKQEVVGVIITTCSILRRAFSGRDATSAVVLYVEFIPSRLVTSLTLLFAPYRVGFAPKTRAYARTSSR